MSVDAKLGLAVCALVVVYVLGFVLLLVSIFTPDPLRIVIGGVAWWSAGAAIFVIEHKRETLARTGRR